MTVADLNSLADLIQAEHARRDRIKTACDFINARNIELAGIATEYGVIPYESREKHLPGQVVVFDGIEYVNVSGHCTVLPPNEPLVVWEPVMPDPPAEVEPEPTDPA